MSASQLNVDTSSSPRQPLDSQKNAGADMSMMAFVQPGCPASEVFLPTPSWLSTPEYTVPALIVRDHSYQPIVTRTLSSVDTFPTIQPIVSFTGPVIGSGRDLLHGNSAAALDDTQLSCCGFKMTERRDSQFQSNALFTCTGKIAGLLDHQIMKHAPAFDQDYIFIVVPDTWTFHDKAMSARLLQHNYCRRHPRRGRQSSDYSFPPPASISSRPLRARRPPKNIL
ncbi:hypothetical protein HRG_012153 [Hirsutella rhossiliensis]